MERSRLDGAADMDTPLGVVFDLGEVLTRPRGRSGLEGRLAGLLGVEESAFAEAYWAHRDAYDLGSSDLAYWSAVADALGVPLPPGAVDALVGAEVDIWTRLDDASRILVEDLRRRGTHLALLSNAPHALARTAERSDWSAYFDQLMFSADHGLAKPDPAVYQRMTALLGTRPERVVFFDDRGKNIDAAREHGWDAHLWTGVAAARAVLADRGLLPRGPTPDGPMSCDTRSR
ncbi:HAD family phosphatase [Streptomyces sp. NEAU-YJ-81]|uniref:HAD family hydrolase n=1 Tax=Streptomyces sp. NEAU-YJ-81 TaxID=2820288 RepID=UPI001ABCF458|nr:HAD family phosphatase [Streptomyces sp. NEAU-YJ-81]MBO3674691.1 HAD family phosphatase [Streptomyces sp. NEAU-YJ-81]